MQKKLRLAMFLEMEVNVSFGSLFSAYTVTLVNLGVGRAGANIGGLSSCLPMGIEGHMDSSEVKSYSQIAGEAANSTPGPYITCLLLTYLIRKLRLLYTGHSLNM
jgi:hypothetical protein